MKKTGRRSKNIIDMRPGKHSAEMLMKRIKHRDESKAAMKKRGVKKRRVTRKRVRSGTRKKKR